MVDAARLEFTAPVVVEDAFDRTKYLRNLFAIELGEVTVSGGTGSVDEFVDNLTGGTPPLVIRRHRHRHGHRLRPRDSAPPFHKPPGLVNPALNQSPNRDGFIASS